MFVVCVRKGNREQRQENMLHVGPKRKKKMKEVMGASVRSVVLAGRGSCWSNRFVSGLGRTGLG
jgi:hypothetical protein